TRARAAVGKQTLGSLVNGLRLLRRPAPAGWKSWAVRAADENVAGQIPDPGLTRARVLKHIVRVAVAVKIGCSHQCPATGKGGALRALHSLPARRSSDLTRARAAVGKRTLGSLVNGLRLLRRPAPAGWKSWAVRAADENVA